MNNIQKIDVFALFDGIAKVQAKANETQQPQAIRLADYPEKRREGGKQ